MGFFAASASMAFSPSVTSSSWINPSNTPSDFSHSTAWAAVPVFTRTSRSIVLPRSRSR